MTTPRPTKGKIKEENNDENKEDATTPTGPPNRVYYSYADIHQTVATQLVPQIQQSSFQPTVIIAIGGGGFIPARMLRTELRIPILAVSLELYDDTTNTVRSTGVEQVQWFREEELRRISRNSSNKDRQHQEEEAEEERPQVLIVDEVDDTRRTLHYCVDELLKTMPCLQPADLMVCVVHNKVKRKTGRLPSGVRYLAGADVPGETWLCYPWEAATYNHTIYEHEALAAQQTNTVSST